MINNWKRQVLEEVSSLFEKGIEATKADESQQAQINELYLPGSVQAPSSICSERRLLSPTVIVAESSNSYRYSQIEL